MLKLFPLLVIFVFLTATANAQRRWINGYLRDSLTHLSIANGNVTNTTTKKSVQTDASGFFRLQAAPNDFMYAFAKGYRYDTLRYSLLFRDTVTVFLPPAGDIMEAVTVTSAYSKYQMDSAARKSEFDEARGQTFNAISKSHTSGFGLVINLDRFFKRNYRLKKRDERMFNSLEKEAYINYRFPPQFVALYTGLKGDALLTFMQCYRPAYEWLRQHPSRYDMIDYINDKLKAYKRAVKQ